jgi:tetratricopeptide (TPR) repeat protein
MNSGGLYEAFMRRVDSSLALAIFVTTLGVGGCALIQAEDGSPSRRRITLEQHNDLEPESADTAQAEPPQTLSEEALPPAAGAARGGAAFPDAALGGGEPPPHLPAGQVDKPLATTAPDSLLALIGPTTPPQTAAAFRLIEEGRTWLERGQIDRAQERFERAVATDPANVQGYYFLAQAHYLAKRYDQAEGFVSRAIGLAARSDATWQARIYALQGSIFEAIGRYPEARQAYQIAMRADPLNTTAQTGLARLSAE